MDHMQIILFAGAVAAALAGTYIIWGPPQRPKRKTQDAVPGLQNLGNSCFLNAVLQALSSCSLFIIWLNNVVATKKKQLEASNGVSEDVYSLSTALGGILKDLNETAKSCTAVDVIDALRKWRWRISNEEQDAHELFHVLTTTLEEEVLDNPPVLSLLDITKLEIADEKQANISKKPFICTVSTATTKNTLPFRGLLANQLICKQCGYKYPVKYDTFDSVSLSIPSPFWGPLKLQDCLQKYVSCEQVSDVTCDECTKTLASNSLNIFQKKTTFIKQLSFGKLPECLCFHIQRTVWLSNGVPTKCFDHVAFPEVLSMDHYVYINAVKTQKDGAPQLTKLKGGSSEIQENSQSKLISAEQKTTLHPQIEVTAGKMPSTLLGDKGLCPAEHLYVLKAVIVHLGDLLSGHFVTYRRGPLNTASERKWFCASDSSTREVALSEVMKVCAYMLFYEKLSVPK